MAIAYETNSTATHSGVVPAVTQAITITKPTGLATGDVLVVVLALNEDSQAGAALASDPTFSGFTKLSEMVAYSATAVRRGWVYYKLITDGAGEPSDYTFTVTYAVTGTGNIVTVMSRFSGVNTVTPINANSALDGETLSTTMTFNGVTTTVENTMLALCGYVRRNLTVTYNDGTKIADIGIAGTTAAAGETATMGYLAQAGVGASGDKTGTISGGSARENDAMIVALGPIPVGGISVPYVHLTAQRNIRHTGRFH